MLARVRFTLFLFMAAMFGAACTGTTDRSANHVDVPSAEIRPKVAVEGLIVTSTARELSGSALTPTADYAAVETAVQAFLDVRSQVITGETARDALDAVAIGTATDAVLAEQASNDASLAAVEPGAVTQMADWSNIETITGTSDSIVVSDCVEHQQVNAAGQYDIWFIERNYVLTGSSISDLRVSQMTDAHNGFFELDERFGCAPQSFSERAELAAGTAWAQVIAAAQRPDEPTKLSSVFHPDLVELVQSSTQDQDGLPAVLASDEQVALTTLGVDTHGDLTSYNANGHATTVVVEACRQFPDGLVVFDAATGIRTQILPAGAATVQWIYVRIPTGLDNAEPQDQVVLIEDQPDLDCGGRP